MRSFWHLLRADVRRFRVLLAIWVILIISATLVEGFRPVFASEPQVREPLAVLSNLLWWSRTLLTIIFVPLVIQADAAVGTSAFWMTRPVPRLSLAMSKLAFVILTVVVLPAIAEALLMRAHGFAIETIAGVVSDGVVIRGILALMLAIAASVTANFARFAILCGATIGVFAIFVGILIAISELQQAQEQPTIANTVLEIDPTGEFVFNGLFVFVLGLAIAVQYLRRSRTWTVIAGVVATAIVYLISSLWPWPFLKPILRVPPTHDAVHLAVDESSIATHDDFSFFPSARVQWSSIRAHVMVEGLEPGWAADIALREGVVRLSDGATLRSWAGPQARLVGGDYMRPSEVLRDVLQVKELRVPVSARFEPPPPQAVLFMMRQPDLAAHARATGEYLGRMSVSFSNFVVEAVLPLEAGAAHQGKDYRLVVDRVDRSDRHVTAMVREARAHSMWHKRPWSSYSFYFRNRVRGEAMSATDYDMTGMFSAASYVVPGNFAFGTSHTPGFITRAVAVGVPAPAEAVSDSARVDANWLAGAELVVVRRTDEGSVPRELRIAQFPLGNPPPAANNRP